MRPPSGRLIAFVLFCLIMLGLTWWGVNWLERVPGRVKLAAEELLREKARDLRDRFFAVANFEPRVLIRETVFSRKTSDIAEIAVLVRDVTVEREFIHTWAGSTKRIRVKGDYSVKCGFDLLDQFSLQIEPNRTRVTLPQAKILSVEAKKIEFAELENGLWNPVSKVDTEQAVAELQGMARQQAGALIDEAEASFQKRLGKALGSDVEFIVAPQ